jgi:hypothetical protein
VRVYGRGGSYISEHIVHVLALREHFGRRPVDGTHGAALRSILDELALDLGEAKVRDLEVPLVVEQQVERLEIAVGDTR